MVQNVMDWVTSGTTYLPNEPAHWRRSSVQGGTSGSPRAGLKSSLKLINLASGITESIGDEFDEILCPLFRLAALYLPFLL